jgi:hypothetical protein
MSNSPIAVYDRASAVPNQVYAALSINEPNANCVLPMLGKSRQLESGGEGPLDGQLWVVCSSRNAAGQMVVDFVLSVTQGYIDSYPLFFYSTRPVHQLTQEFVVPRMQEIVRSLASSDRVPLSRVYAVYGPDVLARTFALQWTAVTRVANYINAPYYAAKLSFCTRTTFRDRPAEMRSDFTFEIRAANVNDIPEVARSCYGFAADGVSLEVDSLSAAELTCFISHHTPSPKRTPIGRQAI